MRRPGFPHAALIPVALGVGALAFGPGAGAASAADPAHWAYPQSTSVVRATAGKKAHVVGRLHYLTEDGQAEVYRIVATKRVKKATWVKVDLPGRPNGRSGWVPKSALGTTHTATQRLVVSKAKLRATLYSRTGKVLFTARVGMGRPSLPTPSGHFYVREKLRAIGSAEFGPFAIGTSAYAPSLSEWPGGGVVGIHGTNQPELIPGRPSHGCMRMRNADITRLWPLIDVGTPIAIA